MKRKLLILISFALLLCAIFVPSAFAEEVYEATTYTYHLVNSADSPEYARLRAQGKTVLCYDEIIGDTTGTTDSVFFSQFNDGEQVEIIFAEDIFVPQEMASNNTGILINKPITVTFNYNGFGHYIASGYYYNESDQQVLCDGNGIVVRNKNATVRLIGTKGVDSDGAVSDVFGLPTYNAETWEWDITESNLDVYKSNNPYLIIYEGNSYCENLRGYTSNHVVRSYEPAEGTYEFYGCAASADGNRAINLESTKSKIVMMDNCYFKGLTAYSVLTGSFTNNTVIAGDGLHLDSWHPEGKVWTFENCTITGKRISTSTGRTYLTFTDCTFAEGMTWSLSGDNGGNQYVRIYVSPTCEEPGSFEMKQSTNKGNTNPFEEELTNYSAPALGHTGGEEWAVTYEGEAFMSPATLTKGCTRCGLWEPREEHVRTMFTAAGYSVPQFGGKVAIALGFTVDTEAIEAYEEILGIELSFGFVTASETYVERGTSPLDESGNVATENQNAVIKTDVTSKSINHMEVKLNLPSAAANAEFLISGYVLEQNGEAMTVSYIQANKAVKDNRFEYVSYNSLVEE